MVNLKTQIPSETPGDIVQVQKGRAILSLNQEELQYLVNISTLITISGLNLSTDAAPTPPASAPRVIAIGPITTESVAA